MNGVAWQDPLGNHVGLPCGVSVGGASEVIPAGYNDGSPLGVISRSYLIAHRYKRLTSSIKCCVYFILLLCFEFRSCHISYPCRHETRFHVVILCILRPGA